MTGPSPEPSPLTAVAQKSWQVAAWLSAWCLAAYLAIVLPIDRWLPWINEWYWAAALMAGSALALRAVLVGRSRGWTRETLQSIALLSSTVLLGCLAADAGFKIYTNRNPAFRFDPNSLTVGRETDANLWNGELTPDMFRPTTANFELHKPNQSKAATTYGEYYYPALLRHERLKRSVLQARHIELTIDRFGLRNTTAPAESTVFLLGDSFAFGHHVTQAATVPVRLGRLQRAPVYNLGVSGSSPLQQLLLLEYLLDSFPAEFKPQQLLWFIFEGNDLEDDYAEARPQPEPSHDRPVSIADSVKDTLPGMIANVPAVIRRQSIVRRISDGEIRLSRSPQSVQDPRHYQIDGEVIAHPLYHSERFGDSLFRQDYIDRARRPESYVRQHRNFAALTDTFRRMSARSRRHGFSVTVVAVPSSVRLYRSEFDFEGISERPHFLDAILELARTNRFDSVDLHERLAPHARAELLYQTDDTHWNERGHEVVAELLAKYLEPTDAAASPGSQAAPAP